MTIEYTREHGDTAAGASHGFDNRHHPNRGPRSWFTGGIVVALACGGLHVACTSEDDLPAQDDDDAQADEDAFAGDPGEALADAPMPEYSVGDRGAPVARASAYLQRLGYFPDPALERLPGWTPVLDSRPADPALFDETLEEALARFQEAHGLHVDGTLNEQTQRLMAAPRCGFPDHYRGPTLKGTSQFAPLDSKWHTSQVRYRIKNYSTDLPQADIRAAIAGAFARWGAVANLVFHEVQTNINVDISFAAGDHGDGRPFDGPGKILAHASPPGAGLGGDIHLDDAETWEISDKPGSTDLRSVVLHEMGHALGLGHSSDPLAVMYAYYGDPRPNLRMDDISGIQSLYGHRVGFSWSAWGPIPGKHCVKIDEPADPHAWADNYFCSDSNIGAQWSMAGPIPGMRCTGIDEPADPNTWADNYLCVPDDSAVYFHWNYAGPDGGNRCVQWHEFADPHAWEDNFLCYTMSAWP